MKVFNTINPDYNFWEIYPEFKKLEEFKYIQKEYKAKSSDVMWFIVLCFDTDSKFYNLEIDTRTEVLSKDYLKDKNWYKENAVRIGKAVELVTKLIDTPSKRHKRQLVETLDRRTKFLKETEYDLENYDKLDRMVVGTAKIFETLKVVDKQLNEEKGSGATKGGHELSLADSDEI